LLFEKRAFVSTLISDYDTQLACHNLLAGRLKIQLIEEATLPIVKIEFKIAVARMKTRDFIEIICEKGKGTV
jgi:hypothetical protein